jgi:hypothetical protein
MDYLTVILHYPRAMANELSFFIGLPPATFRKIRQQGT